MGLYSFVLSACNGRFDARHLIVSGSCVMTAVCLFASSGPLKAKSIDTGVEMVVSAQACATTTTAQIIMPEAKPAIKVSSAEFENVQSSYKLSILKGFDMEPANTQLTRLSDLELDAAVDEFSPQHKESCSIDAAKAAAQGDTSKISPCITALLSGDDSQMADMPRKMADFFIETMNDPNRAENAPAKMINSMMAMMEAMTTKTGVPQDTSSVE